MSLQSWLQNSWLVQRATSPEEIKNLLAISDRDLSACQVNQLPSDWRCAIAYNAALQAATAALAAGYRAARDNHHYRVIQSLEFTTAPGRKSIDTLDGFRKKRNVSSYDVAGAVSDKEADEMLKLAASLRADVEKWIRATHSELFKPTVWQRDASRPKWTGWSRNPEHGGESGSLNQLGAQNTNLLSCTA